MNVVYRVILKVSYHEAHFEFEDPTAAMSFAQTALMSMVSCEDTKKKLQINLQIVDVNAKESEEE